MPRKLELVLRRRDAVSADGLFRIKITRDIHARKAVLKSFTFIPPVRFNNADNTANDTETVYMPDTLADTALARIGADWMDSTICNTDQTEQPHGFVVLPMGHARRDRALTYTTEAQGTTTGIAVHMPMNHEIDVRSGLIPEYFEMYIQNMAGTVYDTTDSRGGAAPTTGSGKLGSGTPDIDGAVADPSATANDPIDRDWILMLKFDVEEMIDTF